MTMIVATSNRVFARNTGGNTTYARALYEQLPAFGIQHEMVVLPGWVPSSLRKPAYGIWDGGIAAATARKSADVFHATSDTGPLVRSPIPLVGTIHGMASLHVGGVRTPVAESVWRFRVRRLAAVADHVVTVSTSSARDLTDYFGIHADRLTVIPQGIDHERFNPHDQDDERVLSAYGVRAGEYVLYLGNLDPRKNLLSLLDAWEAPGIASLGLPLIVAGGKAWGSERVVQRLSNTPNVHHLGQIPDGSVAPLMRHARLFVFPSHYEGFGLPVLEAMACGAPVACSDRGSLAEVAGAAAQILPDITGPGIAEALASLLPDDEALDKLRSAGPVHAAGYTWQATASAHASVFRKLVA